MSPVEDINIFKDKTAVVAGSSGFVGTYLVSELKRREARIIELDIKTGTDVSDWDQIREIRGVDIIFHLAARLFIPDSMADPRGFYESNLSSTMNLLELCRLNKAKFIYTSSYVYGSPEYFPIDEIHPVTPHSSYTSTKILSEQLCRDYFNFFDCPIVILRPFNLFGIGQDTRFLIPAILSQLQDRRIELKDPSPKRDYLYVTDLIEAQMKAAAYEKAEFDVFNIGSGKSHSVQEIVDTIQDYFKGELNVNFSGESRRNEILDTIADISKAEKLMEWSPKVTFDQGLRMILDDYAGSME